jgi:hypothetical protein
MLHVEFSAADFVVSVLLAVGFLGTWLAHERTARGRANVAESRHEEVIKRLADQRALALGAVQQRAGIEMDLVSLKSSAEDSSVKIRDLDVRVGDLERRVG